MLDMSLALPEEVCLELGHRARARRLALNVSVEELSARIGVSDRTLRSFELTGRCTLGTFVRVLEVLNALPDLQPVLVTEVRSIDDMRRKTRVPQRKRAGNKRHHGNNGDLG